MKSACPNCGAPIEFRYDDSYVRICDSCHSAVLRTDRELEDLGAVGDLMPMDSPLKLFAEGTDPEGGTFLLVGMAQLKHEAGGTWQEWYAKGDGGKWSWLAEAQGRYYLTREAPDLTAPAFDDLEPGETVSLGGVMYTVGEKNTAEYTSARGEIPYRLEPDVSFDYADLADGHGKFATIDYGEDDKPHVYLGTQVTLAQLKILGGEDVPDPAAKAGGTAKLACPNCSGALELRAPDATLRVVCPYCNSFVSVADGNLRVLAKLASKPSLAIPLGSKGNFGEGEMTVIGYVERSASIDGAWYNFDEYLLYDKALGFRWLACSDGHWSYVQPIAPGAVEQNAMTGPTYDGVTFKLFQNAPLRVDKVFGELYWQVNIGDMVSSQDFIAPPAMLSVEGTKSEQNWSLSKYLTEKQLRAGFGTLELSLNPRQGVAPNQVFSGYGWGLPMKLAFLILCVVGIARCESAKSKKAIQTSFLIAPGAPVAPVAPAADATAEAPGNVVFSEKFHLDAGKNIEIIVGSNVSNSWMYAAVDLVNDATGGVVSFDTNVEYYSGYEDGESWSEGSTTSEQMLGPTSAGDYVLRIEAQHGATTPQQLNIGVYQDVFRHKYFWYALGILSLPLLVMWLRARSFEKKKWENSNVIFHGGDDD